MGTKREYLEGKINELEIYSEDKNIRYLHGVEQNVCTGCP